MRIVFMGTPEFAVPSLRALRAAGHEIVAVVTQPDRPRGRGLAPSAPPVARAARDEGLWSGPSTGASLVAALRVARELGEDRRVVTVLVDSGLKYLGGSLYA